MAYKVGDQVKILKVAGLRGRSAIIKHVYKVKGQRNVYALNIKGYRGPYHCTSEFIDHYKGGAPRMLRRANPYPVRTGRGHGGIAAPYAKESNPRFKIGFKTVAIVGVAGLLVYIYIKNRRENILKQKLAEMNRAREETV